MQVKLKKKQSKETSKFLNPGVNHPKNFTASPFSSLTDSTFSFMLRNLPCAPSSSFLYFLPTQAYKGRALQLIKNLPVEFRCDKRSYSCRQDGEKAALAAAIALLSVSKMKRLYFEARPLTKTPKHLTRCIAALPLLLFWHPLSSDALQWGSAAWTWASVLGLRSWPSVWRCCP